MTCNGKVVHEGHDHAYASTGCSWTALPMQRVRVSTNDAACSDTSFGVSERVL